VRNTVVYSFNSCPVVFCGSRCPVFVDKCTIPNSVSSICNGVFAGCTGLTAVSIPGSVARICDGAFRGCAGLFSVILPDSVEEIGKEAFDDCPDVTLTVKRGSRAEEYCIENGLRYVYNDDEA